MLILLCPVCHAAKYIDIQYCANFFGQNSLISVRIRILEVFQNSSLIFNAIDVGGQGDYSSLAKFFYLTDRRSEASYLASTSFVDQIFS